MEHYVYSGEKKHVLAGIGIFTVFILLNSLFLLGSNNHRSHQDYMEKADKARLSSSSSDK
ncbi:hypothetical protein DY000_02062418 [Brassica cretica]|uniref:Uncharacterized protein n=1 Tax=Brassica cretica TaxID=69181 RepID=A0ABQ7AYI0_BRACR|nr:hypothetical protein DY000_02062418 [Brassica cretica]